MTVRILDGNTFVVSDGRGDIEASPTEPNGLFSYDTRFLSTWSLTVDGTRLVPLSIDDLQYFETKFFLVPETGERLTKERFDQLHNANESHDVIMFMNTDAVVDAIFPEGKIGEWHQDAGEFADFLKTRNLWPRR